LQKFDKQLLQENAFDLKNQITMFKSKAATGYNIPKQINKIAPHPDSNV